MYLSQSVTYAVLAALQLAESGDRTPIPRGQLAAKGGMPERFLLGILRDLVKSGILGSTRGGGGGFRLARKPEEVSLLDIIEAVDGPLPVGLPANASFPNESGQWLQGILREIGQDTRRRLGCVTLARLMSVSRCDG